MSNEVSTGQTQTAPVDKPKKKNVEPLDSVAIAKFKAESRKKMFVNLSYLAVSLAGAAFVVSLFSGGRFAKFMGFLGINMINAQTGVYADCTKKENINVPYCQPKEGRSEATWRALKRGGKSIPFNLSD